MTPLDVCSGPVMEEQQIVAVAADRVTSLRSCSLGLLGDDDGREAFDEDAPRSKALFSIFSRF
jgi:hypothetical protein